MKLFKDIQESQFWLLIWSGASVAVLLLSTIVGHFSHEEDLIVKELIKAGHDPLALSCVYAVSDANQAACLIMSQNRIALKKNDNSKK